MIDTVIVFFLIWGGSHLWRWAASMPRSDR